MKERPVLDCAALPLHGSGSQSLSWWGNLGYMLIEGSGLALTVAVYFYLQSLAPQWPLGAAPPQLGPGTGMAVLLVLSLLPNHFVMKWAKAHELRKVRLGLVFFCVLGVALLVLRAFEFMALNVSWDGNAYGSIVWLLMGLHTAHLLTDILEWWVLCALMFSRHADNKRRYGDVQDNTLYWAFVVFAWLAVYGCVYLVPRA
jgi:heme/copper-type cytochrome/quinol oxidase subunit 3